jgi:nucleotide-binding universal stress UspA family protein
MANLLDSVLEDYLRTYRGLISVERIDERSISLSFPFHFASNHRIEVVVTHATGDQYVISDAARVLSELKASGHAITEKTRERLEALGKLSGVKLIREYLVLDSNKDTIGDDIQRFVEAAKTIGDVYFAHRERSPNEREIIEKVKTVLDSEKVVYRQGFNVNGEIEPHKFAFYIPPNGSKALALAVIGSHNTHTQAQVWAFKADDVTRQPLNKGLRVGIIYDTAYAWSDESKRILQSRASLVIPDQEIDGIRPHLHETQGV